MRKQTAMEIYIKVQKGMYGLPQAGILAQKLLEARLNKHGYSQSTAVSGLWTHKTHPISFTLIVNDFRIKYVGKEHALHLLNILKEHYKKSEDWSGTKFIGLTFERVYTGDLPLSGFTPDKRCMFPCQDTSPKP